MNQPLVSVIMPTRNRARLLPRAIRSVLGQTHKNLELIVVDDNSTDPTQEVIAAFANKDRRVQTVRRKRSQAEGNTDNPRNAGIETSSGEYISFLDDDDMYSPQFAERMVDFLEAEPGVDLAYCDTVFHRQENGRELASVNRSVDFDRDLLLKGNYVSTTEIMVRRSVLESVGGWTQHVNRGSDWDLVLRVSDRFEVAHVAHVLGHNFWGKPEPCQPSREYWNVDYCPPDHWEYDPACWTTRNKSSGSHDSPMPYERQNERSGLILTMVPYCPSNSGVEPSPGQDLGHAYNTAMERLKPGDWACFLDHDALFTTPDWYRQLEEAVKRYPQAACFTGVTNRIACPWQSAGGVDKSNHDIRYHRSVGTALQREHGSSGVDMTAASPMSGVMFLLSRDAWSDGCQFEPGFLGVDNAMHRRLRATGRKVYLLPGVYVYHWYRADRDLAPHPLRRRRQKCG